MAGKLSEKDLLKCACQWHAAQLLFAPLFDNLQELDVILRKNAPEAEAGVADVEADSGAGKGLGFKCVSCFLCC